MSSRRFWPYGMALTKRTLELGPTIRSDPKAVIEASMAKNRG